MSDIELFDKTDGDEVSLYLHDGTQFEGEVLYDEKNRPFGEVHVACTLCGGSGRWAKNRKRNCIRCDGAGGQDQTARLYPQSFIDRRDAAARKKAQEAEAKAEARRLFIADLYEDFKVEHKDLLVRAEPFKENSKFIRNILEAAETWGGLSELQLDAFTKAIERFENEISDYSSSSFVGEPKQRMEFTVTCRDARSFSRKQFKGRKFETVHVTEMLDTHGNALLAITPNFRLEKGEIATIRGTVKKHDNKKQWPCTILTRVSVLEMKADAKFADDETDTSEEIDDEPTFRM